MALNSSLRSAREGKIAEDYLSRDGKFIGRSFLVFFFFWR